MLQSLWYMLVLLVQILQTDPNIRPDKLQFEIYAGSVPALTLSMRGTMVQGSFVDADTRKSFGEFESTKRVPQTFIVFPSQGLNDELAAGLSSDSEKSGTKTGAGASTGPATAKGASDAKSSDTEEDLSPFTLDFTKALKLLRPFASAPRQKIPFTEAEKLLGGDKESGASSGTIVNRGAAGSPATTGDKTAGTANGGTAVAGNTAAGPSPSPSPEAEEQIEIRVFPNRIVLSANFMQLVIIVSYK